MSGFNPKSIEGWVMLIISLGFTYICLDIYFNEPVKYSDLKSYKGVLEKISIGRKIANLKISGLNDQIWLDSIRWANKDYFESLQSVDEYIFFYNRHKLIFEIRYIDGSILKPKAGHGKIKENMWLLYIILPGLYFWTISSFFRKKRLILE